MYTDVQFIKLAEWIKSPTYPSIYICSHCRNEAYWGTDYGQQLFDYCPYCGRKMSKPMEDKK